MFPIFILYGGNNMGWYDANLKNDVCYGMYKFKMLLDLQELYKKYLAGEIGGGQLPCKEGEVSCESTFCDNFETDWFLLNTYVSQFGETFQATWFTNNNYINDYAEGFDSQWFTYVNYIIQDAEDFEGVDWDE